MRYKSLSIILKAVVLAISWLTLSPLLLILDGRWKLLPKWLRVLLFLVSPMMLIIIAVAAFWGYSYYSEYYIRHHFVKRRVIENITGVRLPRYKVVDKGEEWKCFVRFPEHAYHYELKFRRMPDEAFYEKLDEHFDCFEPGVYNYSAIWGNGMEAPKGESDKDDIGFSIDIERDSNTCHVRVWTW